jgi:hypothetical protein
VIIDAGVWARVNPGRSARRAAKPFDIGGQLRPGMEIELRERRNAAVVGYFDIVFNDCETPRSDYILKAVFVRVPRGLLEA